jgi:Domain of unknown function (DUF4263)
VGELAPQISENVLHLPREPGTYSPPAGGPQLSLAKHDAQTGAVQEVLSGRLMVVANTKLPDDFKMPAPPARPLLLASISNELEFQLHGTVEPSAAPTGPREVQRQESFVARSRITLPVGWRAIEVYPPLGDEYWKPEFAPLWAELDILATIAQRNLQDKEFKALDPRLETRKRYAALLAEFEALLQGPEEPVHQFLKLHPELLNPTCEVHWSKLPFGDRVSDFVFREPPADYELVEIEAPIRELFRQDGQQRQELTHAINQTYDWIQYIADNKSKVEDELGLIGIAPHPRTLVVIGRSASLTQENRRKLVTLQAQQQHLRILTYDDVLERARACLERILGPMGLTGQNIEVYFYSGSPSLAGNPDPKIPETSPPPDANAVPVDPPAATPFPAGPAAAAPGSDAAPATQASVRKPVAKATARPTPKKVAAKAKKVAAPARSSTAQAKPAAWSRLTPKAKPVDRTKKVAARPRSGRPK